MVKIIEKREYPNIHNSNRIYNLGLTTRQEEMGATKITTENEHIVEAEMNKLQKKSRRFTRRDNNKYLLYYSPYPAINITDKVLNHGGEVIYYTDTRIPKPVIKSLRNIPTSYAMYQYRKEFSDKDVENVMFASMATLTVIDLPAQIPHVNPYDVLFSLFDLRYHVDVVKLSFPPLNDYEITEDQKPYYEKVDGRWHVKTTYKYEYMQYIREDLAIWAMALDVICDSDDEIDKMRDLLPNNKAFLSSAQKERVKDNG